MQIYFNHKSLRLNTRPALAALCALCAVVGTSAVDAAEIQLRGECRSEGGLVLLGDVAEIHENDADQRKALAEIDLVPAPPDGQRIYLRQREIEDLLVLRGVNLRDHRFSGASRVQVVGKIEASKPARAATAPALPSASRQTIDQVRRALAQYLEKQREDADGCQIKFALSTEQARSIAAAETLRVEGGAKPWTGSQNFVLIASGAAGRSRLEIETEVTLAPRVVVAATSLGRGAIIRSGDVRLQPGQPNEGQARIFRTLEDAIGKETTRQIAEGQILDDQVVRPQVLVHRNEIVTVYARTAGVQVRTSARAREDGSAGELVTVESLNKRESFFARVSGPQTVDVYAHALPAHEDDQAARPANAARLQALKPAADRAVPVSAQQPIESPRANTR